MSTVQVPEYTTVSTIAPAPLSYQVDPNIATILPITATAPVSSRSLKKNPSLPAVGVTPISAIPIVSTDAGPIYQVELNKRLLDGQRELKEKQADMEADKEKKLEEKADKHRTKAVKWIGRGFPGMAARHERNATKLDVEANKHYMVAEQLRAQAKAIDRERKSFDPPKEEKKKPVAKNAAMRRPAAGAPPAQRSASSGAPQQRVERPVEQRPVEQRPVQQAPRAEEQPSLRKDEPAPVRDVPVSAAPVEEVKTEKRVEETPEGDKKIEKTEHHHLHHHEKTEQTAGGSSH